MLQMMDMHYLLPFVAHLVQYTPVTDFQAPPLPMSSGTTQRLMYMRSLIPTCHPIIDNVSGFWQAQL